ncbi:Nitrilase/cyanide hydratase and apolipoprotein N-acyltransferase family protein [Artemisia annua]|uniref:Nitrilase/cyanide hydratase and apolipoprotein N-acyltransferase family protein n=1 Tax=Artemisia annua TaxID=35608 RepID=A0A2U1NW96_ARTAN|nr:Nitrilase/cyanide hydratase and apolipoprotein N-acyltransferase family protein [Artemisia annua]
MVYGSISAIVGGSVPELAYIHSITIVGGSVPELDGNRLYNTCCVFGPNGKLLGKHRKLHLFDIVNTAPGELCFNESDSFAAGNQPTVVDTDVCRIGIGICHDIRFPELAMLYQARGVELICYPSAFNITTGSMLWELEQQARQIYIATCSPSRNSSGSYEIWGHSTLVAPDGEFVGKLEHEEGVLIAEIDLSAINHQRWQFLYFAMDLLGGGMLWEHKSLKLHNKNWRVSKAAAVVSTAAPTPLPPQHRHGNSFLDNEVELVSKHLILSSLMCPARELAAQVMCLSFYSSLAKLAGLFRALDFQLEGAVLCELDSCTTAADQPHFPASVHDAMLEDVCHPAEIVGKRVRYRLDGSKIIKIYLDPKARNDTEYKLETFSGVYRKLSGKDVVFEYPMTEA